MTLFVVPVVYSLIAAQHESRRRFLELVAEIRPELHRYCARMMGSVFEGEDVVQAETDAEANMAKVAQQAAVTLPRCQRPRTVMFIVAQRVGRRA